MVTVWNRGDAPAAFVVREEDATDFFEVRPVEGSVPPGGETEMVVACEPTRLVSEFQDPACDEAWRAAIVILDTDAPYPRHRLTLYATCLLKR